SIARIDSPERTRRYRAARCVSASRRRQIARPDEATRRIADQEWVPDALAGVAVAFRQVAQVPDRRRQIQTARIARRRRDGQGVSLRTPAGEEAGGRQSAAAGTIDQGSDQYRPI